MKKKVIFGMVAAFVAGAIAESKLRKFLFEKELKDLEYLDEELDDGPEDFMFDEDLDFDFNAHGVAMVRDAADFVITNIKDLTKEDLKVIADEIVKEQKFREIPIVEGEDTKDE